MNCLGEFGVAERQPSKVNVEGSPGDGIPGLCALSSLRFQSMARSTLIEKARGSAQNWVGHWLQQKPTT